MFHTRLPYVAAIVVGLLLTILVSARAQSYVIEDATCTT
jgi:hypothetical protein